MAYLMRKLIDHLKLVALSSSAQLNLNHTLSGQIHNARLTIGEVDAPQCPVISCRTEKALSKLS